MRTTERNDKQRGIVGVVHDFNHFQVLHAGQFHAFIHCTALHWTLGSGRDMKMNQTQHPISNRCIELTLQSFFLCVKMHLYSETLMQAASVSACMLLNLSQQPGSRSSSSMRMSLASALILWASFFALDCSLLNSFSEYKKRLFILRRKDG